MWQSITSGALGIFIILIIFLGFPPFLRNGIIVITGIIIAFLSFWSASKNQHIEELFETKSESEDASIQ